MNWKNTVQAALISLAAITVIAGCGTRGTPNEAPTVSIAADYTFIKADMPVDFQATAADSDGTITKYTWDFGDDVTAVTTVATVSHTYTSAGDYSAAVTVKDDDGAEATASIPITITPAAAGPLVKLDSVDLDVSIADGLVSEIDVNGSTIPVDGTQTAIAPVELSGAITSVTIDTSDIAGNPADTYQMTLTKTE